MRPSSRPCHFLRNDVVRVTASAVAYPGNGKGGSCAGTPRPSGHAVARGIRQRRRFAHAANAPVLDEDRAVLDDPPLRIDGDDVAGVVDLEALGRHGDPYAASFTGPGTAAAASRRRPSRPPDSPGC